MLVSLDDFEQRHGFCVGEGMRGFEIREAVAAAGVVVVVFGAVVEEVAETLWRVEFGGFVSGLQEERELADSVVD